MTRRSKIVLFGAFVIVSVAVASSMATLIITRQALPHAEGANVDVSKRKFFRRGDRFVADAALGDSKKSSDILEEIIGNCDRIRDDLAAFTACHQQAMFWAQVDAENDSVSGSSIMGNDLTNRSDCFSKARAVFWYRRIVRSLGDPVPYGSSAQADNKYVDATCKNE